MAYYPTSSNPYQAAVMNPGQAASPMNSFGSGVGNFLSSDAFLNNLLPLGINAAAGWYGNKQQSDAADQAAQYQDQAAGQLRSDAWDMYGRTAENLSPYQNMFSDTISQLPGAATSIAPANLQTMQDTTVNPANLRDTVDWNLENDPIYQAQRDEMMRNMNRGLAASGQLNSSAADDALVRNMSTLMGQSYDRSLEDLNRGNQNELTRYGMRTDQYGRDLGNLQMGNQNEMARYGMDTDEYGRLRDLGGMGINAGLSAGGLLANTGQQTINTLGQSYQYGADALANAALTGGLNNAQTAGMLGNIPLMAGALDTLSGGEGLSGLLGGGGSAAAAGGAAGAAGMGAGSVPGMSPAGAGLGGGAAAGAAPALNALAGGGTAAQAAGVGGAGAFNSATATGLGTSGLGLAAGALPFAAMGGYILNKGLQQNNGPDQGINPVEYLRAAAAGERYYTNPETGQVFTITPESIERVKNSAFYTHGVGGIDREANRRKVMAH